MSDFLEFTRVVCGYGDTTVVRGVSGAVGRGRVLAVLGRNGVGKSTLLKALSGVLPISGGAVTWEGRPLGGIPLHRRLDLGLAYTPQENVVFGELSVADNLWLHLKDRNETRYGRLFTMFPLLPRRLTQRAGSLSGGERKLLSFARTLGLRARMTLIDEPTEGVQPENIERMAEAIRERRADGASFIVVEQNLEFARAVADQLLVLDHGVAVLYGDAGALTREDVEPHLAI